MLTGDTSVKYDKWWLDDRPAREGTKFDNLTSQYGLKQILKEPIHISGDHRSCIHLIFTSQTNLCHSVTNLV